MNEKILLHLGDLGLFVLLLMVVHLIVLVFRFK